MMILTAYIQYKSTPDVTLADVNPVNPWGEQREAHSKAFKNLKQKSQAKSLWFPLNTSGLSLLKCGCWYVSHNPVRLFHLLTLSSKKSNRF